jgi:hypothetical protein
MTVSTSVWSVPPLPVAVWIYGGGRQQGSGTDPKHNFGYVVRQSVEMGKPVIGVSVNYRAAGLGFLYSQEIRARSARRRKEPRLMSVEHWECGSRIEGSARGATVDPDGGRRWPEMQSAGACSVRNHQPSYGGRSDGRSVGWVSRNDTAGDGDTDLATAALSPEPPSALLSTILDSTRKYSTAPRGHGASPFTRWLHRCHASASASCGTRSCTPRSMWAEWFAAVDGDMIGGWARSA